MRFVPAAGAVVAERYRLERVIAYGSASQIWRAHDHELEAPCAVKLLLAHLAGDPRLRAQLAREAEVARRLSSAHTVRVLGFGEHEGASFLAMELLLGETLAARLERAHRLERALTLSLLEQVSQVLEQAHGMGIVHRDLKPDNIWLCSEPGSRVLVLDFGLALFPGSGAEEHAVSGALVGTPHYMSPEQARAEGDVDHRSDLWALAVLAVECLTGKRPFEANGIAPLLLQVVDQAPPPLSELGPDLPPALEGWWQRALARDRNQRFHSAAELVAVLKAGLTASASPACADSSGASQ